ncbi:hypothetical protein [Clostridium sardiniense]|uniref:hypothetical protein n=1 Tax=Clostridium sardiniense TaxID=29369 RepID=UPI00195AF599|nr:hypothetical protein [Clostridium sardiniense]MBM7835718.1 hypothetical protein [Clostridium sardiniense]
MDIKRWDGQVIGKRELINMAVMAKPVDRILMIREDKVDDFLSQKRDNNMWDKIQKKAEILRKNLIIK